MTRRFFLHVFELACFAVVFAFAWYVHANTRRLPAAMLDEALGRPTPAPERLPAE